jgi:hypothetical protein
MSSGNRDLMSAYAIGNLIYLFIAVVIYNTASYQFDDINGRTAAKVPSERAVQT